MSSAGRKQVFRLFPERYKTPEERAQLAMKRRKLVELSEVCLAHEHEQMGERLARLAKDGYWPEEFFRTADRTGPPRHPPYPSVYQSESRYRLEMARVAMFFNEKGLTGYGGICAELADRPDLDERLSSRLAEEDKKGPARSKRQDSDHIAQGNSEVGREVGPAHEEDTGEPVDIKKKHTEEDEEAETSVLDEPLPPRADFLTSPADGNNSRWPAGGFDDDDSAAPYIIHVMKNWLRLAGPRLTLDDVKLVDNPEMGPSDLRPYQQVSRKIQLEASCNFWFPRPLLTGCEMGKVDCSVVGLATIIQALWAVVLDYDDTVSIPGPEEQIRPVDEADGAMVYVGPLENSHTYFVLVEPFKPHGIRSALEALQMAARHSTAGKVIFYVNPVDVETRGGDTSALLDIHPIIGCED